MTLSATSETGESKSEAPAFVFTFPVRVYYEDTDAQGHVYHPNYLKFAERARTELLNACGHNHDTLLAKYGVMLAVKRVKLEFFASARLDERLEVRTSLIGECGPVTFDMRQSIHRGDKTIASVECRIVALSREGKAQRMPAELRESLQAGPRIK